MLKPNSVSLQMNTIVSHGHFKAVPTNTEVFLHSS